MGIVKKDKQTIVEFGTGDIAMNTIVEKDFRMGVILVQDSPGKIGNPNDTGRTYDDDLSPGKIADNVLRDCVRLEFTKYQSVDLLIELLEYVREDLLSRKD